MSHNSHSFFVVLFTMAAENIKAESHAVLFRLNSSAKEWDRVSVGTLKLVELEKNHFVIRFYDGQTKKLRSHYNVGNRMALMDLVQLPNPRAYTHHCCDFSNPQEAQSRIVAYRFDTEKEGKDFAAIYKQCWDTPPTANITLKDLIDELIIEPGKEVLSLPHSTTNQTFYMTLTPNGEVTEIVSVKDGGEKGPVKKVTKEVTGECGTPTKAVKTCFDLHGIDVGAGNGWRRVEYKGKKLEEYRMKYVYKLNPTEPIIPSGKTGKNLNDAFDSVSKE